MQSIYQDQLLAFARHAREQIPIPLSKLTHVAEVNNPICGDRIRANINIEKNVIVSAHAEAKGCALCEAGAGLWLNTVVGLTMSSMQSHHVALKSWLEGQEDQNIYVLFSDTLHSFASVRAIKNRHKCITLAFSTADRFKPI